MLLKNLLINSSWSDQWCAEYATVVGFQKHDDTKYQLLPLCTFQVLEGSQIEMIVVIER
jgi:hypothetical protein